MTSVTSEIPSSALGVVVVIVTRRLLVNVLLHFGLVAPAFVAVRLVRGRDPDSGFGADLTRLLVFLAHELLLLPVPLHEAALPAQLLVIIPSQVHDGVLGGASKVVAQSKTVQQQQNNISIAHTIPKVIL